MIQGQHVFSLQGNFTARYVLQSPEKPSCLVLLLHGYSQKGEVIFKKTADAMPSGAAVLAPNGPVPVIWSIEDYQRVGFSWYFYEGTTDEYYMDMALGRHYIKSLVEKLGFSSLPKIIVGYSQGGYLAPFVAQDLQNIKGIVGVNCQFLDEELMGTLPQKMDLICGENDEVVDPQNSKKSFERLISKGVQGKFILVPGATHGLSSPIVSEVKKALAIFAKS